MAYANSKNVAAFCKNLINNASDFSSSTTPTLADVSVWIEEGAALIDVALASKGVSSPTDPSTAPFIALRRLNALYGAAYAEMARTNTRLAPGERTRGQVFLDDFNKGLEAFLKGDLSRAGLGYTNAGFVGGTSQSEIDTAREDSDRPADRFTRDQFKNNET